MLPVELLMRWDNTYFVSVPVRPDHVAELLPRGLSVDCFEGDAYLSVVGFEMKGIRPRGVPRWLGRSFVEINLRTYVLDSEGRRGIYFFSLDADDVLSVAFARRLTYLPYRTTETSLSRSGKDVHSKNVVGGEQTFSLDARVCERIQTPRAKDRFLCERYRFYTEHGDALYMGVVEHDPWQLRRVEAEVGESRIFDVGGVEFSDDFHVVFSDGVAVETAGFHVLDSV
jgi:hypothetical protein